MSGTVTGPELVPGGLVRPVSLPEVHLSLVFSMLMWLAGLTALYAGDGIMAWIGDPLPVDDPAGVALVMAAEARDVGQVLSARRRARGHDLGVGIGVALGHATLGVVGGVDRRDDIATASVVNLAARLCAEAGDGEVLVDPVRPQPTACRHAGSCP